MHPVLFKTQYFTIYSYGFCMALAVLLAWGISSRLARRAPYMPSQAGDLLLILFICGVLGARIFYIAQHASEYSGRWITALYLQEGGLVWYGGFIGAVAAAFAYTRWKKLPLLKWADLFSTVLPLGQAVGRLGCFLNGCCYGRAGLPVQLFESAGLALLSVFLFFRFFRLKKDGDIFALYLIGYGSLRFGLEFLRGDQTAHLGLTLPQWISAGAFLIGSWLYARLRRSDR